MSRTSIAKLEAEVVDLGHEIEKAREELPREPERRPDAALFPVITPGPALRLAGDLEGADEP